MVWPMHKSSQYSAAKVSFAMIVHCTKNVALEEKQKRSEGILANDATGLGMADQQAGQDSMSACRLFCLNQLLMDLHQSDLKCNNIYHEQARTMKGIVKSIHDVYYQDTMSSFKTQWIDLKRPLPLDA